MITREEWVDIVSLHRQGLSIRAISARLGVSRNTLRAASRRQGPPIRQARALRSKLDPYRDYLLARLADYPELSAAALCEEVRTLALSLFHNCAMILFIAYSAVFWFFAYPWLEELPRA